MKKRVLAMLLVLLALVLAVLPAYAASGTVYFTAINNTLLELEAKTIPVVSSSMIYVPCSVFNSLALGTYGIYSREKQLAMISDGERYLYFDMSTGNSYDQDNNTYFYAAIYQNDTAYVPAYFVARHFELGYSYIRRDGKHIVRLTKGEVLSDSDFFEGASTLMENRLNQYLRSQETLPPATTTPRPTIQPTPTPAVTTQPSQQVIDRRHITVYLHILGLDANTASALELLEDEGVPACFYATAAEVEACPDLVRRILGSGLGLGVRLEAEPEAEYQAFSQALRRAAMTASFLAVCEPELQAEAEALGLHLCPSGAAAEDAAAAGSLLAAATSRCDLRLAASFRELDQLLERLYRERYRVAAVNELS